MADLNEKLNELNNTADTTSEYDQNDIQNNKGMAVLGYLGLLFLIPRYARKDSKYAQFHTNQGHTLAILDLAIFIITRLLGMIKVTRYIYGIPYEATPWWVGLLTFILSIPTFVLTIIGIVNAAKGKAKELPLIGKYKFLK